MDVSGMDDEKREERAVPVIEEELVAGTRAFKTGSIRVRKSVERIRKQVDMPVMRDVVKVSRVPVNRRVTGMPAIREEGDTVIVPVVEEEIIVKRRLVLKEEIHIVRRRVDDHATRTVTLGREHATVERLDSEGNVVATSKPHRHEAPDREKPASHFKPQKSLLE
jgi:uncharacterized protein (TIGR02271 family)